MIETPAAAVDDREDLTALDPKAANVLYHDVAARSYDDKWSISFDERCIRYVRDRAERMLPRRRYGDVLEVGTGTGFFILNLWQAGFAAEPHATDISPGMVAACLENARRLGCDLRARVADAESLPYPDASFDLVTGHAFLHHLSDPDRALREFLRVLKPGGALFIAGEPTVVGDRIARTSSRLAAAGFRAAGALTGWTALRDGNGRSREARVLAELESAVDLHTFDPAALAARAGAAGFSKARVETEELVSSVFGWAVRTIESEARPGLLGPRWAWFAYRGYLRLYALDRRLLAPWVPRRAFYNVLLYAERPPER